MWFEQTDLFVFLNYEMRQWYLAWLEEAQRQNADDVDHQSDSDQATRDSVAQSLPW